MKRLLEANALQIERNVRPNTHSDEEISCYCGLIVKDGVGDMRLACGCLGHYQCLVDYLVSWTYDRNFLQEWGIPCPYGDDCEFKNANGCMRYISKSELTFLKQYGEERGLNSDEATTITDTDIENFQRFTLELCTRLDCGCYSKYEDIVRHIKLRLDSVGEEDGRNMCDSVFMKLWAVVKPRKEFT